MARFSDSAGLPEEPATRLAPTARDVFFQQLIVGGSHEGRAYLELPLKAALVGGAKSAEERRASWDTFFARVLREEPPQFGGSVPVPYWGDFAYRKADWRSVADAVGVRVGDVLRVRTPSADGSVRVVRYAIHFGSHSSSNLLLAVAQPLDGFRMGRTEFLVAASQLPGCEKRCTKPSRTPDQTTLAKIRTIISTGAKIPQRQPITEIRAFEGRFTRLARQYVVYANFGTDPDGSLVGFWRTMVLDSDLSVIAVVGENEYSHIVPWAVGDVDGDGLDEIWVGLVGYEGRQAGLMYWGGVGLDSFRMITNTYNGL